MFLIVTVIIISIIIDFLNCLLQNYVIAVLNKLTLFALKSRQLSQFVFVPV